MRIFCNAKDSHISPKKKKKKCIYNIYVRNFNETFTNDVVNFEQPVPAIYLSYPGIVQEHSFLNLSLSVFSFCL